MTSGFTDANVNNLVYAIVIFSFIRQQPEQGGRFLQLKREKQLVAGDDGSRGREEFVVLSVIRTGESYVFVVEAKSCARAKAMYDM